VVLKPSEISKSTEKVLVTLLPQYLDKVRRALSISTWHSHTPVPTTGEVPLSPGLPPELPVPPHRAALLWCWVGPKRLDSC
jgi:hypothetical protein